MLNVMLGPAKTTDLFYEKKYEKLAMCCHKGTILTVKRGF